MEKCGIITINTSNYGNRLQNYALQEYLKGYNVNPITIKNIALLNKKKNIFDYLLRNIKYLFKKDEFKDDINREKFFAKFNENINFSPKIFNWFNYKWLREFDYFIVGSDQVWNPVFGRLSHVDLLTFADKEKRISYAASFGIKSIPEQYNKILKKELNEFKAISVRENEGKKIADSVIGRDDIEVLIDPTMLLTAEEWDRVAKRPEQLKNNKYILNYFLGELPEVVSNEINRIAKLNGCEIINILDKKSPFYHTGPSEFLYLEKNAFLICTDSFHSSVFAIIYNRPFVVFERKDKTKNMNSRIETLISKFNLKNRDYNGNEITTENLNHDYTEAYQILEQERKKSEIFLKKALDKEGDK